jgi:protein-L-isoaspartate(D-aspartate) O-methyltransferase
MALSTQTESYLAEARERMVASQLRPNKVSDPRILDAMRRLKRERFLPSALRAFAYADDNVSLGSGRVLSQPMVQARMIQAATPSPGEAALVVGAGTGYAAAVLAVLGLRVTALEESAILLDLAHAAFATEAPNVTVAQGPLPAGWPSGAPYDVILIEGAVPEVSADLASQLRPETGRLVTIISERGGMGYAALAELTPAGVSVRPLFDCQSPVLPGFDRARAFEF